MVLPSLLKGPKDKKKLCETASAQQIFGRAGRPQFDDRGYVFALAHEDDVKIAKWREKYDSIPEDTKDPGLLKAKKQLKKKMPKRRSGESYWTEQQFEQLQNAESADLSSRGRLPWRLLAYLFGKDPNVQPIRDLVGRRLLSPQGIQEAQRDLNRMLITLWTAGYIELDPKPHAAEPKKQRVAEQEETKTEGLFGDLLDQMRGDQRTEPDPESNQDPSLIESRGYEVENYRPLTATPTERLDRLVHLKSINPLFGVYLADQLAIADPQERIAALESVLLVPGTVARFTRMPSLEEMPPGILATSRLDPQLLQLGLATAEELGAKSEDEDDDVVDRGFGRVMFDEPRVWPLTIGEKILRLFRHEFPRVHNVDVRPVWIVGELLEFGGDFNKYVTARKLQKEEGILFRHCLRMILLLDEMANIPPIESTVETWEDPLDDLAEILTKACQAIDPQSTDEILLQPGSEADDLIGPGRRNS